MRAQRPPHLPAAIDANTATATVHQWADFAAGLRELRRVTRGPVVVPTFDGAALDRFWLAEYAPEVIAVGARHCPPLGRIAAALGVRVAVEPVPIPLDCTDGFSEAYYGRPEALLDPDARRALSARSFVGRAVHERFERKLRADLASGAWDTRHGHLGRQPKFGGSLRLIVGRPDSG